MDSSTASLTVFEQHRARLFGLAFGTPRDVTLDELRIECAFPADEATAEVCRALARAEG